MTLAVPVSLPDTVALCVELWVFVTVPDGVPLADPVPAWLPTPVANAVPVLDTDTDPVAVGDGVRVALNELEADCVKVHV